MRFDLEIDPLDLGQTLGCGQTFRWRAAPDGTWSGPLGDQFVVLRKAGRRLIVEARPGGRHVRKLVRKHLRADDDIDEVHRVLGTDKVLADGISQLKGLRIVKIDEWECLASFVLATYANIPRITKMIETLSTRYGTRIAGGVRAFPTHSQLARATSHELMKCGLGYRAQYVKTLCETIDEHQLEHLRTLPYEKLRKELVELPGVGDKVADCVSLFGFGRLEAFPIDVWIERALARLYGRKGNYSKLRAFAAKRFGPYAGYAQEYLFYNERLHAPNGSCLFSKEERK